MSYYHAHKDGSKDKDKDGLKGEVASLAFADTVSHVRCDILENVLRGLRAEVG